MRPDWRVGERVIALADCPQGPNPKSPGPQTHHNSLVLEVRGRQGVSKRVLELDTSLSSLHSL